MSNDIAVKVENLSKIYRLGLKDELHESFGGAFFSFIKSPINNFRKYRSLYKFNDLIKKAEDNSPDILWALKDVSFELKQGKTLGVIGGNGAGKSTLLKVLSRITHPTTGKIKILGRVSSLLEVGTGFHQELTGAENVYLNGTILGMKKKEVDKVFDEIVEFSGVSRFLHTPVKRYSSGMKVRLAFAVAAHLDPEILIVDEVLAVGDVEFQKKCMGKMGDVAMQGKTVLFVSHNMGAIVELCSEGLWLENGKIKKQGSSQEVVKSYLSAGSKEQAEWSRLNEGPDNSEVTLQSAKIVSVNNELTSTVDFDSKFMVEIKYNILEPIKNLSIVCRISNNYGSFIFETMDTDNTSLKGATRKKGSFKSVCYLPSHLLKPDRYYLTIVSYIDRVKIIEKLENIITFEVTNVGYDLSPNRRGVITPKLDWQVESI